MAKIMLRSERPNAQQAQFLRQFVGRLELEVLEAQQRQVNVSSHEPLLDLVHGFLGTGKSRLIAWMRELMEDGLGWEHGVQFVCLAFQNAMAAQINGHTLHHWSGIPCRREDASGTGDRRKQSMKCQALRVIIIDEVSMIPAELLGALERVVASAVQVRGTYKKRGNDETRAFGGVNVVMCADFWQLHPVSGTFLGSNPVSIRAGLAQNAMNLFWEDGRDRIRSFWPLTELMRCKDPWYNNFLQQCRNGDLTRRCMAFLHLPRLVQTVFAVAI